MDYDQTAIAATYDAARGYRPEVLRQWLDLVAAHASAGTELIVDLGCGTGRFSQPLSERLQASVIGIDPSQRMLGVARAKPGNGRVEFRQASSENLPLKDRGADLVFMSMVLHHLPDLPATARECRRVLREGGRVYVRNSTRDAKYPQVPFFPGIRPMIENELPSGDDVIRVFEAAALRSIAHERVGHSLAPNWQDFADKIALRADSFLARIADADFATGLAALRAHAAGRDPDEEVTEVIDFFVFER
jgi:ubiquinone/menaquinone biosynthesis C-methylase UbiE